MQVMNHPRKNLSNRRNSLFHYPREEKKKKKEEKEEERGRGMPANNGILLGEKFPPCRSDPVKLHHPVTRPCHIS